MQAELFYKKTRELNQINTDLEMLSDIYNTKISSIPHRFFAGIWFTKLNSDGVELKYSHSIDSLSKEFLFKLQKGIKAELLIKHKSLCIELGIDTDPEIKSRNRSIGDNPNDNTKSYLRDN